MKVLIVQEGKVDTEKALAVLSPSAFKLYMFFYIWCPFRMEEEDISITDIANCTGMTRKTCTKALEELLGYEEFMARSKVEGLYLCYIDKGRGW